MNTRLEAISRRRAALLDEITGERERVAALVDSLRTQFAIAGLGLVAARLLRGSRWLRVLTIGSAAIAAALPFVARLLAGRRE